MKKQTAKKTPINSDDPAPVKLPVKWGKNFLYLHGTDPDGRDVNADTAVISVGPTKGLCCVSNLSSSVYAIPKPIRRAVRKALCAIGRRDLAASSVPSKSVSQKLYRERRESEIRNHTRGRYAESETHGSATV